MHSFSWTSVVKAHGQAGQGFSAAAAGGAGTAAPSRAGLAQLAASAIQPSALSAGATWVVPFVLFDNLAEAFRTTGEPVEAEFDIVTTTPVHVTFDGVNANLVTGRSSTVVTASLVSSQTLDAIIHPGSPQRLELVGYLCTRDFGGTGDVVLHGTVTNQQTGQVVLTVHPFNQTVRDEAYHETFNLLSTVTVADGDDLVVHMTGDPV